jgi:RIO kinase 1
MDWSDGEGGWYAEAARFGFTYGEDEVARPRSVARKEKKQAAPKREDVINQLTDSMESLDENFTITYVPARYEAIWLLESLRPFAERALIQDVLAIVKGGKEANVYLCEAVPETGYGLIAAKVYRPRAFRNLRNDKMYREGREFVDSKGEAIKAQDTREMRAIRNKTSFGEAITHTSWLMYEHLTLGRLYAAGASVPQPIGAGENALLMTYIGDRHHAAPILHSVTLESAREAEYLFQEVLRNVDIMLGMGLIHGDLSPYNILYWEGKVTLIDFPQVTLAEGNSSAYKILQRDLQRVCDYFAPYGVEAHAPTITRRLWSKHVALPLPDDRRAL